MSLVLFARTALVALTALALLPASALAGTQYQYDTLGRLTRVAYDNGRVVLYSYDPAGNRSHVTAGVGLNRPPVAVNDSGIEVERYTTASLSVLDNDSDPDGDPLTITSVGGAGASIAPGGGHLIYAAGGVGYRTLNYTISDGHGGTATASVDIFVFRTFPDDPLTSEAAPDTTADTPEATPAEVPQTPEAVDEQ